MTSSACQHVAQQRDALLIPELFLGATAIRTKVTDCLDAHDIAYRVVHYSEPMLTIDEIAAYRGIQKKLLVKSILLREKNNDRFVMACVKGHVRVDHRAVRDHLSRDWRRLTFATAEELFRLTGCLPGAITPVGLPADIPVFFDTAIVNCHRVNISSGNLRAGLDLLARDLVDVVGGIIAPIAECNGQANRPVPGLVGAE